MDSDPHGDYDERTDTVYDANINRWVPAAVFYHHYGIPTGTESSDRNPPSPSRRPRDISAIVLVALLFGIILVAVIAQASEDKSSGDPNFTTREQRYLEVLETQDITGASDAGLIEDGYAICDFLAQGYTPEQIAKAGAIDSNIGHGSDSVGYSGALSVVAAANSYLC
ncbi:MULTISPECIES: DUF732 domain-containing protein [Actinomycetes]|uniref:DUF732 domain-containing protein n=1 Tax=Actinomycetes TaxID=1760 RepID=UPI0004C239CF|nr:MULTISPECIES: DUF732 domain-containing protein [Actinomycetes]